jgi:hypothetical protein
MRSGYSQDERHVGHKTVAHAEDRCARASSLEVSMMVIVNLKLTRRGMTAPTYGSSGLLEAVAG